MNPPRQSFQIIDFNFEIIMNLSSGPYDFCKMWKNYLAGCGWTEEEFESHLENEVFKKED